MTNQSKGDRLLFVYLAISLVLTLVVNCTWLLRELDVEFLRASVKEAELQAALYVVYMVLGLNMLHLLRSRPIPKVYSGQVKLFVAMCVLGLLFSVVTIFRLQTHIDSLIVLSVNYVAPFLVSAVLSTVYLSIAYNIGQDDKTDYQGYRGLLTIGFCGAGIFSFLYIFEIPHALFLVFTNTILLLNLAASFLGFRSFNIAGRKYVARSIVIIALCVPLAIYARVPLQLGLYLATATVSAIYSVATNDDNHSVAYISSRPAKQETRLLNSTLVFNDYWILNDKERLAVSTDKLMRSNDGGVTWRKEKDLAFYGDAIHFDRSGQRGWVGNRYYGMELTEDGGKTWRTLSPESAYKQASGKNYKEGIFTTISELHLDPQTGKGSFTAKCSYYLTEDFANSWTQQDFIFEDGKQACLIETPFSIDSTGELALVKGLLSQQMYRHNTDKGHWEPVCDLPGSDLGTNYCSDDDTLSDSEILFSSGYRNEDYSYGGTRPYNSVREDIEHYGSHAVAHMRKAPHKTRNTYWFADEGYLATSKDEGLSWNIEQDIRRFTHVLPVTPELGFAWNPDAELWVSRNSGNTWQRFFDIEESLPLDIEVTNNGEILWLLYPKKLLRLSTQSQKSTLVRSWPTPTYTQIGSADNGRVLWVFRYSGELSSVSFDSGITWHDFNAGKAQRTRSSGWNISPVTAMSCATNAPTCFLIRSDNTLSEMILDENEFKLSGAEKVELPINEDDDYYESYGLLAVSTSGNEIVVIPGSGRYSYMSDEKGLNWTRTSLGTTSDYWYQLAVSDDGKTLAVKSEDGLSISNNFGKSWSVVRLDLDYGGESWNYCWSNDAQTMVVYIDDYMAISTNGGSDWNEFDRTNLTEPWCGIGNDLLWLRKVNVEVSAVGVSSD